MERVYRRNPRNPRVTLMVSFFLLAIVVCVFYFGYQGMKKAKIEAYIASLQEPQMETGGDPVHFELEENQAYFFQHNRLESKLNSVQQWLANEYKSLSENLISNHAASPIQDVFQRPILRIESQEVKKADNLLNVTLVAYVNKEEVGRIGQSFDPDLDVVYPLSDVLDSDKVSGLDEKASFILEDHSLTLFQNKEIKKITDSKALLYKIENNKVIFLPRLDENGKPIIKKRVPEKLVAFTFDDGPHYQYDQDIVKLFKEVDGKATFFWLGLELEKESSKESIQTVLDAGFEVGSHSYDHSDFTLLTKEQIEDQLKRTNDLIVPYTKKPFKIFRPPYGAYNQTVLDTFKGSVINWSVDSLDWKSRDADAIYDEIMGSIFDGSIVLMHSIYPSSVEALKRLLPELKSQGYRFVTVSELYNLYGLSLEDHKVYFSPIY